MGNNSFVLAFIIVFNLIPPISILAHCVSFSGIYSRGTHTLDFQGKLQYGETKLNPFIYIKGLNFASPYCKIHISTFRRNFYVFLFGFWHILWWFKVWVLDIFFLIFCTLPHLHIEISKISAHAHVRKGTDMCGNVVH